MCVSSSQSFFQNDLLWQCTTDADVGWWSSASSSYRDSPSNHHHNCSSSHSCSPAGRHSCGHCGTRCVHALAAVSVQWHSFFLATKSCLLPQVLQGEGLLAHSLYLCSWICSWNPECCSLLRDGPTLYSHTGQNFSVQLLAAHLDFEEVPNLSVCLSASFVLVAGIDQFLELSRFCSLLLINSWSCWLFAEALGSHGRESINQRRDAHSSCSSQANRWTTLVGTVLKASGKVRTAIGCVAKASACRRGCGNRADPTEDRISWIIWWWQWLFHIQQCTLRAKDQAHAKSSRLIRRWACQHDGHGRGTQPW